MDTVELIQETSPQYDIVLDFAELTDNVDINIHIINLTIPSIFNKLIKLGLGFINSRIDPININIVFE